MKNKTVQKALRELPYLHAAAIYLAIIYITFHIKASISAIKTVRYLSLSMRLQEFEHVSVKYVNYLRIIYCIIIYV